MSLLSKDQIHKQSQNSYRQWAPQWREHAKLHSQYQMKSMEAWRYSGFGQAALCVANGYSFEENIATIQKYQHNVDIVACDKSLKHLIQHGIKPKFCVVADANVSYEKYLEEVKDELNETILVANVCANPKWTANGNWKDRYFFSVMDVLGSEKEWTALSGCPNIIAAGTNVSNGLVIFLTQCDNNSRQNFFGYDKILLIGFDYCWRPYKSYYAFDSAGGGKTNYMRHSYMMDMNNNACVSSNNLIFSAKWLDTYMTAFKLPLVQCSRNSLFATRNMGVLSEQMQYAFRKEDAKQLQAFYRQRQFLAAKQKELTEQMTQMARDHHYSFLGSVA